MPIDELSTALQYVHLGEVSAESSFGDQSEIATLKRTDARSDLRRPTASHRPHRSPSPHPHPARQVIYTKDSSPEPSPRPSPQKARSPSPPLRHSKPWGAGPGAGEVEVGAAGGPR